MRKRALVVGDDSLKFVVLCGRSVGRSGVDDERDRDEEWRPNFRPSSCSSSSTTTILTYRLEGTAERDADFLFQMLPKDGLLLHTRRDRHRHAHTPPGLLDNH